MILGLKPAPLLPEDVSKIVSIFEHADARQREEVENQKLDVLLNMRAIGAKQTPPGQSATPLLQSAVVGAPGGCRSTQVVETSKCIKDKFETCKMISTNILYVYIISLDPCQRMHNQTRVYSGSTLCHKESDGKDKCITGVGTVTKSLVQERLRRKAELSTSTMESLHPVKKRKQ